MYSTEQKQKAIQAYLENNCNAAKTILQLGYPTIPSLLSWVKANNISYKQRPKRKLKRYSEAEKKKAMDLYFKNGCNMKNFRVSGTNSRNNLNLLEVFFIVNFLAYLKYTGSFHK